MMDITAILHMHAELSLTAVFILMFLLDLFLPATQRHWLRPMACILLPIHPDHRYHTGVSASRHLAKT